MNTTSDATSLVARPGETIILEPVSGAYALTRNAGYQGGRYDTRSDRNFATTPWDVCVAIDMIAPTNGDVNIGGIKMLVGWTWRDSRNINDASRDYTYYFPKIIGNGDYSTGDQGGDHRVRWVAPAGHGLVGISWYEYQNASVKSIQFITRHVTTWATSTSAEYGSADIRKTKWASGISGPYKLLVSNGQFISGINVYFSNLGVAQGVGPLCGIQWFQAIYSRDLAPLVAYTKQLKLKWRCIKPSTPLSIGEAITCVALSPSDIASRDAIASTYCPDNLTDPGCACWEPMPGSMPAEIRNLVTLPQCWSAKCNVTGYKTASMSGQCPNITVCKQDITIAGNTSTQISGNIITQDCTPPKPEPELPDPELPDPEPELPNIDIAVYKITITDVLFILLIIIALTMSVYYTIFDSE